jgi:hypothetical protein
MAGAQDSVWRDIGVKALSPSIRGAVHTGRKSLNSHAKMKAPRTQSSHGTLPSISPPPKTALTHLTFCSAQTQLPYVTRFGLPKVLNMTQVLLTDLGYRPRCFSTPLRLGVSCRKLPHDASSHGTPGSKSNLNCTSSGIGSFRASSKLAVVAFIGFLASNSLRRP